MTSLVSRNIYVNDHRTSMRLEPEVWHALEEIVSRENITFNMLCTLIAKHPRSGSFTSVIRTFALLYYREWVALLESQDRVQNVFTPSLIDRTIEALK